MRDVDGARGCCFCSKKRDVLSAELILDDILEEVEVGALVIETEIWATFISLHPAKQKNYLQHIPGEKNVSWRGHQGAPQVGGRSRMEGREASVGHEAEATGGHLAGPRP